MQSKERTKLYQKCPIYYAFLLIKIPRHPFHFEVKNILVNTSHYSNNKVTKNSEYEEDYWCANQKVLKNMEATAVFCCDVDTLIVLIHSFRK